jgi:hypothetical protein
VDGGKIVHRINNYAWMSFNFGPTLLSWMAEAAPDALAGIVEGDRLSRERHRGHGNALAQVYNHMILPLASERDKRTQVLWGVADFRKRFGREPEGMWLAETAADVAALEALAAAGLKFTVLAPRQAKRWRKLGDKDWAENPGGIDPSRAYLCKLPSGKSITLFFYDGNISQQVAFERLLDSGEKFLGRLKQGFSDARTHPELMHIATDGESYGHHHPFGDMALAYVLDRIRNDPDIRLTNYGEYLELHPPQWEVEIHDNSSWSCVHGVERWRSDCGCKTRGDWHQQWRGPLRQAFDQLKGRLDTLFGSRGRECFPDPWQARDADIDVILDRNDDTVRQFFKTHAHPDLDEQTMREGLWLLEMQRHGMLMYTSCGWFFDEISGLETTQCLCYAARAIQLAKHFQRDYEDEFLSILEKAPSNLPQYQNGRKVWEELIRPERIDLDRVLAHYAMSLIFRPRPEADTRVYCYDVHTLDQEVLGRGTNHAALGSVRVRSRLTWNSAATDFVVIHYGGLDFYTVLRRARTPQEYEAFKQRLIQTFSSGSLADMKALVVTDFQNDLKSGSDAAQASFTSQGSVHRLDDLFLEEQRRIISIILQDRFEDYQQSFERLANQDQDVLSRLGQLRYPIPKPLRAAASTYLDYHLNEAILHLQTDGDPAQVKGLYERGKTWGYQPERELLRKTIAEALQQVLDGIGSDGDMLAVTARAGHLLDAAGLLGITLDLWQAQNDVLDSYLRLADAGALDAPAKEAFQSLAAKLNVSPALLGRRF